MHCDSNWSQHSTLMSSIINHSELDMNTAIDNKQVFLPAVNTFISAVTLDMLPCYPIHLWWLLEELQFLALDH